MNGRCRLMIKTEFYKTRKDGVNLYKTYSDANLIIKQEQTGIEYNEAIDIEGAPYTYIETDKEIQIHEESIKPEPREVRRHGHN
jgi:hypothetical protein